MLVNHMTLVQSETLNKGILLVLALSEGFKSDQSGVAFNKEFISERPLNLYTFQLLRDTAVNLRSPEQESPMLRQGLNCETSIFSAIV